MANFPGNPFRPIPTGHADADVIAKSIQLLAFEVRTANLQRQADVVAEPPDFTDANAEEFAMWEGLQREIGTRLGLAP